MIQAQTKRRIKQTTHNSQIMEAAESIFAEKGFYLTTVEEIAQKADLGKGTIYLHFENKRGLFLSIIERKLDILLKKIEEGIKEGDSPAEKIRLATEIHFKFLEKNRNFFKIIHIFSNQFKKGMGEELFKKVVVKNSRYLEILQTLIERATKKKEIKSLNSKKLAVILVGIVHSLTVYWISQNEKDSLSMDHSLAWEIFWQGAKNS
ncbi:TetR/AcrR family transcriptional regulator [Patescibacteria group bacterium]|nr:TetR/AcrR family transcriptional regulator [Patescibacteria group bacterium]